jgi:hypothetical protein
MSTVTATLDSLELSTTVVGLTAAIVTLLWLQHNRSSKVKQGNEPDMLPGSLPLIGHILKFANDPNGTYQMAKYVKYSYSCNILSMNTSNRNWSVNEQPVSLSVLGQRIYVGVKAPILIQATDIFQVILSSRDISAVWRSKAVSFTPIVEYGLTTIFGLTVEGGRKLHSDPDGTGDMYENTHPYFRDAMGPGENLNTITQRFMQACSEDIKEVLQQIHASPSGGIQVELRSWIRNRMGIPSTLAMVGPRLLEGDPEILERLAKHESYLYKFSAGLPKWMMKAAHENLAKIIDTFVKVGKDSHMLPWLTRRMEMCEARNLSPHDVSVITFTLWMA